MKRASVGRVEINEPAINTPIPRKGSPQPVLSLAKTTGNGNLSGVFITSNGHRKLFQEPINVINVRTTKAGFTNGTTIIQEAILAMSGRYATR